MLCCVELGPSRGDFRGISVLIGQDEDYMYVGRETLELLRSNTQRKRGHRSLFSYVQS